MSATASRDTARTYLTFLLGDEEYGIEILRVREIIGMLPITPVPGSPSEMLGVINLRGKVIPVVSMRRRFGLGEAGAHPHNVVIVVEGAAGVIIGCAVDRVKEVAAFGEADTEPPPAYGLAIDTGYVSAIGKSQGRIRILLDILKVVAPAGAG